MTRRRRFSPLQDLAALTGLMLAVACAVAPPPPPPPVPPPVPVRASSPPATAPAPAVTIPIAPPPPPPPFQQFLDAMRSASRAQGISAETFAAATTGLQPIPAIADSNENQPEFSRPVWAYLDSAVSARRIKDGQFLLGQNKSMLDGIAAAYGVPREILMAVWALETDYGRDNGAYNLFTALATLGYQGPRMAFARPEFLAALKILQEQHYAVAEMRASWAGAFGQTQFTPTTFLRDAVDGDGDGHINLWSSSADALASAANLLKKQGWKSGAPRVVEVKLPARFAYEDADVEIIKPVAEWRRRGVTTAAGNRLPAPPESNSDDAAIYLPAGAKGPAFLLFPNFNVILKYNNAASYALAVSLLADRIAERPGVRGSWPRNERGLSRDDRINFQLALAAAGFDPGSVDGVLGRRTRAATRAWQKSRGLVADGYPSSTLLAALQTK